MTAAVTSRSRLDRAATSASIIAPVSTLFIALLSFAGAVILAAGVTGPVRTWVVLVALLVAPGLPVVRLLGIHDRVSRAVLVVVTSVAIETVIALLMAWTHVWAPLPASAALLLAAGWAALLRGIPDARTAWRLGARPSRFSGSRVGAAAVVRSAALGLTIVAAGAFWITGLRGTSTDDLGVWGLLPALPVAWYIGAGLSIAAVVMALVDRRTHGALRATAVTLFVVVLTMSADIVEAVPRPPWIFKHIAVTAYISAHGGVDASIDIYNRWPGFFSVSAFLGQVTGHVDPLDYARWAEGAFSVIDGALVLGIARTLGLRGRWAWVAAVVFTAGNWVGQNYYSPQAFAFMLYLSALLIALAVLRRRPFRFGRWIERVGSRVLLTKRTPVEVALPQRSRTAVVTAIVVVLLLQGLVTASHQLTPFVVVATLAPLFLMGYLRVWWTAIPIAAMPILYLIPNLDYVQTQFGLFTGFDPVSNLTAASVSFVVPSLAATLQSRGVMILTAMVGIMAVLGIIRRVRQGHARQAVMVLWLIGAPSVVVLGQSYGGEAKFRLILFAMPFLAIGVAWLFHGRVVRLATMAVAVTVASALFIGTTMQPEATNRTAPQDVAAASWLDGRFASNDTLLTLADFPALVGGGYSRYLKRYGETSSLVEQAVYFPKGLTTKDVYTIIDANNAGGHTWLVFSAHERASAIATGVITGKQIDAIEESIASVSAERYDRGGVRVYELDDARS